MSSLPELKLDWASHAAAKYACEHWHYSRTIPVGKMVKIGVWEVGKFIGVVLFSRGATPEIGSPYGLSQMQICELTRVALTTHTTPVSRIIRVSIAMLRRRCSGLRLIVSFADAAQGHHGGIYQAGGWQHSGSVATHAYRVLGALHHPRSLYSRYGVGGQSIPWLRANVDVAAERVQGLIKHRYLMPLDDAMRAQIAPLAKPYPKRAKDHAAGYPPAVGGETPTRALQSEAA